MQVPMLTSIRFCRWRRMMLQRLSFSLLRATLSVLLTVRVVPKPPLSSLATFLKIFNRDASFAALTNSDFMLQPGFFRGDGVEAVGLREAFQVQTAKFFVSIQPSAHRFSLSSAARWS